MFPGNRLLPQTARVNYPEIAASLIVKNGRFCVSLGVARLKVTCTDAQVTRTGELKLREGVGTTRIESRGATTTIKKLKHDLARCAAPIARPFTRNSPVNFRRFCELDFVKVEDDALFCMM